MALPLRIVDSTGRQEEETAARAGLKSPLRSDFHSLGRLLPSSKKSNRFNPQFSKRTSTPIRAMNRELSTKPRSLNEPVSHRLAFRLDQLRTKLVGFKVVDPEGQLIGEVKDLILNDQQRLNLVVSQPDVNQGERFFLIPSRLVSWVRSRTQTVSITLTQADIRRIPEYHPPMQASNESTPEAIGSIMIEQDDPAQAIDLTSLEGLENQPIPPQAQGPLDRTMMPKALSGEVVQEETIRLLEERLAVDYTRHKIGEVIVRKEIETRMIEVPVRREKLIVEQVSPEHKQLAEIDLGQGEISGVELRNYITHHPTIRSNNPVISGEFSSSKTAGWLLDAIAHQPNPGVGKIRIEIELEDASNLELYQEWFNRCSIREEKTVS
jgi:stress response protein YsnF/sporulation protein YlmC with PRC-barrel domain